MWNTSKVIIYKSLTSKPTHYKYIITIFKAAEIINCFAHIRTMLHFAPSINAVSTYSERDGTSGERGGRRGLTNCHAPSFVIGDCRLLHTVFIRLFDILCRYVLIFGFINHITCRLLVFRL